MRPQPGDRIEFLRFYPGAGTAWGQESETGTIKHDNHDGFLIVEHDDGQTSVILATDVIDILSDTE